MKRNRTICLLSLPYHCGRFGVGMGRGPKRLIEGLDLVRVLEEAGHSVRMHEIDDPSDIEPEIARIIELDRRLAVAVSQAMRDDEFPIVLAGNCNSCLGTCAGIGKGNLGVAWFDAHADFDTPDDNLSGFFDVMGLSMLTGSCWKPLCETIQGFRAVEERDVLLMGVRDLESHQWDRLRRSAVNFVTGEKICREGVKMSVLPALDMLQSRVKYLYLHIDLDCLDTSEGKANQYAAPGGMKVAELKEAIVAIFDRFNIRASAVTAYDPGFDGNGRMGQVAVSVVEKIAHMACGLRGIGIQDRPAEMRRKNEEKI